MSGLSTLAKWTDENTDTGKSPLGSMKAPLVRLLCQPLRLHLQLLPQRTAALVELVCSIPMHSVMDVRNGLSKPVYSWASLQLLGTTPRQRRLSLPNLGNYISTHHWHNRPSERIDRRCTDHAAWRHGGCSRQHRYCCCCH